MKAAKHIFLFILTVSLIFSCKKKESLSEILLGKWYVERFTEYDDTYRANTNNVVSNKEKVGTFLFNGDGTGVYVYHGQSIDFKYTLWDDVCNFTFDQDDIQSYDSPIILYYQYTTKKVTSYTVFLGNPKTANFYYESTIRSNMGGPTKIEFLLTKME